MQQLAVRGQQGQHRVVKRLVSDIKKAQRRQHARARQHLDVPVLGTEQRRLLVAHPVKLKALPNPGFLTEPLHLFVVNSHVHWDPKFADVKVIQTQILLEEMERITGRDPVP